MKTHLLWKRLLIGCLMLASLTGCASSTTETPTSEPTDVSTISPTDKPTIQPTAVVKPTITPLPFTEGTEFPTGSFEHVGGHWTVEFREDGTGTWYSKRQLGELEIVYGVNGNLYADMWFYDLTGRQVPATYYWTYDGEFLIFQVWGKDLRPTRKGYMHGQTYKFVGEAEPVSTTDTVEFPTGRFINEDGLWAFNFNADGTWRFFEENLEEPVRSGKYVTSARNFYMEMTHDDPDLPQVPVTYIWTYDGQKLTFELWKEDVIEHRKDTYDGQTYTRVDE